MTGNQLVIIGAAVALLSGLPALVAGKKSNVGQLLSSALLVAANVSGLIGIIEFFLRGPGQPLSTSSPLGNSQLTVGVDALSAFFLLPLLLVSSLATIYGLQYWRHSDHPDNGRRVTLFLGALTSGMTLLLVANDGLVFLAGWEIMALSAFFAVGAEDDIEATRKAAWLYLCSVISRL